MSGVATQTTPPCWGYQVRQGATTVWETVSVSESGRAVWKDGSYVDGAAGITGGRRTVDYVTFDAGSGTYSFRLTGR